MFFLKRFKVYVFNYARSVYNSMFYDKDNIGEENEEAILLKEADLALKEWKAALNNMNYITDFEAIDFNIYLIQTAERKYIYILNKAKKEQVVCETLKKAIS